MAVTQTSRTAARQQIATLLAEIETFVAVYDHATKDFGRRSPVAMAQSDGTRITTNFRQEWHRFAIDLFWQRADDDVTEDYSDDLALAVRQKLAQNDANNVWRDLQFEDEFSQQDYVLIDGVQYRWERIRVRVQSVLS